MGFLASAADERVLGVEFTDDALSVSLRDGRIISVPLVWYPRLLSATAAQRKNWKIAGGGYGLHWPDIDEDLSTEGLLRGAPAAKALPAVVDGRKVQERDHPRIIPIADNPGCYFRAQRRQVGSCATFGNREGGALPQVKGVRCAG